MKILISESYISMHRHTVELLSGMEEYFAKGLIPSSYLKTALLLRLFSWLNDLFEILSFATTFNSRPNSTASSVWPMTSLGGTERSSGTLCRSSSRWTSPKSSKFASTQKTASINYSDSFQHPNRILPLFGYLVLSLHGLVCSTEQTECWLPAE